MGKKMGNLERAMTDVQVHAEMTTPVSGLHAKPSHDVAGVHDRLCDFNASVASLRDEDAALEETGEILRKIGCGTPTKRFNIEVAERRAAIRAEIKAAFVKAFADVPEYVEIEP